jgi:hypothetical protein
MSNKKSSSLTRKDLGDFNQDGKVDAADLNIVLENWGPSNPDKYGPTHLSKVLNNWMRNTQNFPIYTPKSNINYHIANIQRWAHPKSNLSDRVTGVQKWSHPMWSFFHNFAEKIDTDYYKKHKNTCLQIIKDLCEYIPCGICKTSATVALKNIRNVSLEKSTTTMESGNGGGDIISSKEEFITMLFDFHNFVNKKNKYPLFPKHKLKIYKNNISIYEITKKMCDILKSYYTRVPKILNEITEIEKTINNMSFSGDEIINKVIFI